MGLSKKLVCRLIFAAISVLLMFSCASGSGELFRSEVASGNDKQNEKQDEESDARADNGGKQDDEKSDDRRAEKPDTGLHIDSTPSSARISLNGSPVGRTPLTIRPPDGRYRITAEKDGYYRTEITLRYSEGEFHEINLHLDQIVGQLIVRTEAPNARVNVSSRTGSHSTSASANRRVELPVGTYTVEVRAFGFETERTVVSIRENQTTEVPVEMTPVPFRVDSIETWRGRFSSHDAGRFGQASVRVEVTAPGSAQYSIADDAGRTVYGPESLQFSQRTTVIEWDGLDERMQPLPDGDYVLLLESETGSRFTRHLRIDSTISMQFRPLYGSGPGTLFAPLPTHLPRSAMQIGFLALGHADTAGYLVPINGSLRFAAGDRDEIAASFGMFSRQIAGAEAELLPYISLFYSRVMLGNADSSLSTSIQLRGTYRSQNPPDYLASDSGAALTVPIAAVFGPLTLSISPEAAIGLPSQPILRGYLRGAAVLEVDSLTTALSAAVRSTSVGSMADSSVPSDSIAASGDSGLAVEWPATVGVEAHWLIPSTGLVASLGGNLRWHPEDGWYLSGGGGVHVLFGGE